LQKLDKKQPAKIGRPLGSKSRSREEIDADISEVPDMQDKIRDAFEARPDARWQGRVFKLVDKKQFGIFNFDPADSVDVFTEAQKNFGAGDYRAVVWCDGIINQSYPFSVMVRPDWKPPAAADDKPATASGDPLVMALLARMDEDRKRSDEMFARLLVNQQTNQQAPQQMTMKDMVETMIAMQGMVKGSQGENSIDLIMKGVELVTKVRGEAGESEGGGSNMADIIRDAFKMAPAAIEAFGQATAAKTAAENQQRPQPQRQVTARPVPQHTSSANGGGNPYGADIAFLVSCAERHGDTETWARATLETVAPAMIEGMLAQDDPVAFMAAIDPRVNVNKIWFGEFFDILREVAQGDDAPPGEGDNLADGVEHPSDSPGAGADRN
jgi:hypothetical protein